mmetsp:Transcript_6377/g.28793  ORF Transcript_6377/g.28793 Transcript_6377/m.28793 type:complete len:203 (-) Transcript_6377:2557-3165(-)
MSAARVPRSDSRRSLVKMSARCSSQKTPSMAMRRESAANAAPRSSAWPSATAGWPHKATTTGAYAATMPLPTPFAALNARSSVSASSLELSRWRSSDTDPCPSAAASAASSELSSPFAAAASALSAALRSRSTRARRTARASPSTCTRCLNPTSPRTNKNLERNAALTFEAPPSLSAGVGNAAAAKDRTMSAAAPSGSGWSA